MTTATLITDDFEPGPARGTVIHNIVYGPKGFVDDATLTDEVFDALLSIGAIKFEDEIVHDAGVTRLWVFAAGAVV